MIARFGIYYIHIYTLVSLLWVDLLCLACGNQRADDGKRQGRIAYVFI